MSAASSSSLSSAATPPTSPPRAALPPPASSTSLHDGTSLKETSNQLKEKKSHLHRLHLAGTLNDNSSYADPNTPFPDFQSDFADGVSAAELFGGKMGYTYDDLILLPGHIDFSVDEINLSSKLTKNITLTLPFVSTPMDTVTEAPTAIAMALQGGIGIIHYNCSIRDQQKQVDRVKRWKNGFITDPKTLSPTHTLADVEMIKVKKQHR